MSGYRAFLAEDDNNERYRLSYYHYPQRWRDNILETDNPLRDPLNWSAEFKYLNPANDDISDDINQLPCDSGGIYIFFVKGINLPFIENYILYIGRCQYTNTQNIRKRAREYFRDTRSQIKRMFNRWGEHLYYRYFPDTDNDRISANEVKLIRAILPEHNEKIPDRIEVQPTVSAFS